MQGSSTCLISQLARTMYMLSVLKLRISRQGQRTGSK
jgi:hypothetical protein